jgi:hypothetical protein
MVDDTPEDAASAPDSGRAKRAPPTIELEASEVSDTTTATAASEAEAEAAVSSAPEPEAAPAASVAPDTPAPKSASISPWIIAPFSGAVAASLVILVGWMLGWPKVLPPPAVPQVNTAAIDDLGKRVAAVEGKINKPDPLGAVLPGSFLKQVKDLQNDVANLRAQEDKLAASVNDMKSVPRESAGAIDLSDVNARIAKIEDALRARTGQDAKAAEGKTQDEMALRRVVAAALLDVAVRHGDPYAATLATAKSLAQEPDALKPLDAFADTGVPNPPALNRELLMLVPKLSPSALDGTTTGSGLVDRLQAGAAKLIRIERTDATGNDRGAIVARVTAAAVHNDFAAARHELSSLSPADRAPVQAWLDKATARDAALAASRQFADDAMASLAKPAQ